MTDKEMQMEFERRIQLISPDLKIEEKPNSDLIFSILNEAQDRYMMMNYLGDDQTENGTRVSNKGMESIKNLLVEKELVSSGANLLGFKLYRLPYNTADEYFLYVNSFSKVTGTYKQLKNSTVIPNKLIKYEDLEYYATTAFNKPIIRQPAVALMSDPTTKYAYLAVAIDKYTTISNLILTYYRKPLRFGTNTNVHKCELPESVHSEIVDLAVEMFIVEGKYRLQAKQQSKE